MAKGALAIFDEPKGGSSEKEDAAQDLIDAIKEGDAKGVALAFATLCELCGQEYAEEPSSEDDED